MTFEQLLKSENNQIIFGGAVGTELQRRGVTTTLPLWSAEANITHQDILEKIYIDYIEAGTNCLITNTFRTTHWVLKDLNKEYNSQYLVDQSIKVLKSAIDKSIFSQNIIIGGSITSLEDCYEPDLVPENKILEKEHLQNIEELLNTNFIDFIALETFNSKREIEVIVNICNKKNIPFVISLVNNGNNLLDGTPLTEIISFLEKNNAKAILLNCRPPKEITQGLTNFSNCSVPFGGYANGIGEAGSSSGWDFEKSEGFNLSCYLDEVKKWKNLGATIIGGCCGTTPEYVKKINSLKNI